jgi:lysophospholipase L1-like esterase
MKRALEPTARPAEGAVRVPKERGRLNAEALASLAKKHDFHPLFMQQVVLPELPGTGSGQAECNRAYEGLEPAVAICDLFVDLGPAAERYFVDTMHANESGHALIADAIAEAFRREGWISP